MEVKIIIGIIIGAVLGFFYHKKIGCKDGTCPITASRYGSILYGALIGFLLSNTV